jgi:formylmethanofuran dehydrogenase subunit A
MMLRIRNGRVFDPANGRHGEIGDVCVRDGKVVDAVPASAPLLEARHLVVMPGAIDLHTHVAGPALAAARLLRPEDGGRTLPTLRETGRLYAAMGYTTIMEAAVAPIGARAAHEDLDAIPIVDKGLYVLMGNNALALRFIREGRLDGLKEYVAWVLEAARGFAVKAVNPGGVEAWKCGEGTAGLDDRPESTGLTGRDILQALAGAVRGLGLPHPLHLHMHGLGLPGNADITLATMDLLRDLPVHYTHLQFHCYGGRTPAGLRSRARDIAARVNALRGATVDVGQVIFGPATTLSADAPAQHRLHRATGRKWLNLDVEVETGCGIVPHEYRADRLVAAVQWAIGLELLLLIEDPRRVFLTTDHPNGGAFTSYPYVLRLLMDRAFRDREIARVHPRLKERTVLAGLDREYTLSEIAALTRSGPAAALGLAGKGHLGPGADADVVLYNPSKDPGAMFAAPVAVLKEGMVVAREGEIVEETWGRTLRVAPPRAPARARQIFETGIRDAFETYYTVPFEDYPIPTETLRRSEAVPARRGDGP